MPYTNIRSMTVDGKKKWCFENKETGKKRCSDTYESAVAALRLMYSIDSGAGPTKK